MNAPFALVWLKHNLWIGVVVACTIAISYWFAWLLRFEFSIPARERRLFYEGVIVVLATKSAVFCALHQRMPRWPRFLGFPDLVRTLENNVLASIFSGIVLFAAFGTGYPRSLYLLDLMTCVLFSCGILLAARVGDEVRVARREKGRRRGLLVYGAGVAGLELAGEIRRNPKLGFQMIGFLDDDLNKQGTSVLGLPVLGTGDEAAAIVAALRGHHPPVEEIVVSMPSVAGRVVRAAVEKGLAAGVPCRVVPGLGELISGKLHVDYGLEVSGRDLLSREHITFDSENVRHAVHGHTVLVTGAAGSIGSELVKQLAAFEPRLLIALDQAESEMFRLNAELRERFPDLNLSLEIADIRNPRRIEEILAHQEVDAIFHAAAYKHVPVMEHQICEAVRNNVIGTWNVVQAAWRNNVPHFLLISTDKAVNPSSIMGLTKRVAELIVSCARPAVGRARDTHFVCVRFGNVLVSNGSVVPIFQKQIAKGGPITVTHPDVQRYFMTVQEAVELVLQASTMGQGSEIFVLDMGDPVRVVELAEKMITLAGLVPEEDIEIRFVGLRPGEKLFEEISLDSENHLPTSHPKICVFQSRCIQFAALVPWIAELQHALWSGDGAAVLEQLKVLVPEYHPMETAAPVVNPPVVS